MNDCSNSGKFYDLLKSKIHTTSIIKLLRGLANLQVSTFPNKADRQCLNDVHYFFLIYTRVLLEYLTPNMEDLHA